MMLELRKTEKQVAAIVYFSGCVAVFHADQVATKSLPELTYRLVAYFDDADAHPAHCVDIEDHWGLLEKLIDSLPSDFKAEAAQYLLAEAANIMQQAKQAAAIRQTMARKMMTRLVWTPTSVASAAAKRRESSRPQVNGKPARRLDDVAAA